MFLISCSRSLSLATARNDSSDNTKTKTRNLLSFMAIPSWQILLDLLAKLFCAVALGLACRVGLECRLKFASAYAKRLRQRSGHRINVSRDLECNFQGLLVHRAFRNAPRDETTFRCFLTREGCARHHQQCSLLSSDAFRDQVRHGHSGIEPQPSKGNLKIRSFISNTNVAGTRKNRGNSNTVAFNCGNHWNGNGQQREPAIIEAKHEVVTCFDAHLRISQLREHVPMATDGKVAAGTPHDHGAKLIQLLQFVYHGDEGVAHFRAHGIAKSWIVQSNDRYGAAIGETQLHSIRSGRIIRTHSVF